MKKLEQSLIFFTILVFGMFIGTLFVPSHNDDGYPPQHIKVGPYQYLLRFESAGTIQSVTARQSSLGWTDYDYHLIVVNKDVPKDEMKTILIHEIFHACRSIGGSHYNQTDSDSEVFEGIIPTFVQVMHDNPELEKWLLH